MDEQTPLPSGSQIGQQMGRVEMLLERLMEKVDANHMATGRHQDIICESRESLGIDVLTPSSTSTHQYDGAPILSLFDNAVFGRGSGDHPSGRNSSITYASSAASSPQINLLGAQPETKLEKYRRALIAMLPSQHDLDILFEDSHGWCNLRRHVIPLLVKYDYPFLCYELISNNYPDTLIMTSRNDSQFKEFYILIRLLLPGYFFALLFLSNNYPTPMTQVVYTFRLR